MSWANSTLADPIGDLNNGRVCGCWFPTDLTGTAPVARRYLPQIDISSSTDILEATSRTVLKQTFVNIQESKLEQVHYSFPFFDGVSIAGFSYTVGSKRVVGVVQEKQQARLEYQEAVSRGESAGLLEQLSWAADIFNVSIGNVPAKETVRVEIVYLGELKHDAETDGSRFTIPTRIAPRYGRFAMHAADVNTVDNGRLSVSVSVMLEEGSIIRGLQSPTHPIAVTLGRTSTAEEHAFSPSQASATLTLDTTGLEKDFVLVIIRKDGETPRALLETHSSIPAQRALMTTLVPKFKLPNISPEIVFVVDRSGSMEGEIGLVRAALKVFLKSLPVGVKFNICSFGSRHSFMFDKSRTYDRSSLEEALEHVESFKADYGGTCLLEPVQATIDNRFNDLPLEVMLLTDGQIQDQDQLFTFVNGTKDARFFTLGLGTGVSSALVEGVARAGNGFAQFVSDGEKMDKRVVRMLKGALTPHVSDYILEVTYTPEESGSADEDFELVEADTTPADSVDLGPEKPADMRTISLVDPMFTEEPPNPPTGRYDSLPTIPPPEVLQTPHKIPALYPFSRTTVYLLLGREASRKTPKSVVLRGTSQHGRLELEIPIQDVGVGRTIHQLAAKKAMQELEEGRGWLTEVRSEDGQPLKTVHEGRWDLIVEREAVRLGTMFQVGGKWCSFVAVSADRDGEDRDTVLPIRSSKCYVSSHPVVSLALPAPSPSVSGIVYRTWQQGFLSQADRGGLQVDHRYVDRFGATGVGEDEHHDHTGLRIFSSDHERTNNLFTPLPISPWCTLSSVTQHADPPSSAGVNAPLRANRSIRLGSRSAGSTSSPPRGQSWRKREALLAAQAPRASRPGPDPGAQDLPNRGYSSKIGLPGAASALARRASSSTSSTTPRPAPPFRPPISIVSTYTPPPRPANPIYTPAPGMASTEADSHADQHTKADADADVDLSSLPTSAKIHRIIELQQFDGPWQLSPALLQLLGATEDQVRSFSPDLTSHPEDPNQDLTSGKQPADPSLETAVKATAFAVAWLKTGASTEEELWDLVVDKALQWLRAQVAALGSDIEAESKVKQIVDRAAITLRFPLLD